MSELHLRRELPEANSLPENTKQMKVQCGTCNWTAPYIVYTNDQVRSGQQFAEALSSFQSHNSAGQSSIASWSVVTD